MKNFLKGYRTRVGAAAAASLAASGVSAADYTTLIGTATTDGTANVTAVIAGVIGIAILGFGVGKMLGWFGR